MLEVNQMRDQHREVKKFRWKEIRLYILVWFASAAICVRSQRTQLRICRRVANDLQTFVNVPVL